MKFKITFLVSFFATLCSTAYAQQQTDTLVTADNEVIICRNMRLGDKTAIYTLPGETTPRTISLEDIKTINSKAIDELSYKIIKYDGDAIMCSRIEDKGDKLLYVEKGTGNTSSINKDEVARIIDRDGSVKITDPKEQSCKIVTTYGDTIHCKITGETEDYLQYKEIGQAKELSIAKDQVARIINRDGSDREFKAQEQNSRKKSKRPTPIDTNETFEFVNGTEPEFIGEVMILTQQGRCMLLEKSIAAFTSGISFKANSFSAQSVEIYGDKAITRVPQAKNINLIVKAVDNDSDPLSFITIYKFDSKKNTRTLINSENNSGTLMKSRTHVGNQLYFKGEKYGASSYMLTITDLEPGEYGVVVANPNTVDEKKTIISCFGVDATKK